MQREPLIPHSTVHPRTLRRPPWFVSVSALAWTLVAIVSTTAFLLWGRPFSDQPDLVVELAGCDMIATADGEDACELWGASAFDSAGSSYREGNLTVWAKTTPGATPLVTIDGRPATVLWREESQGGTRMEILVEKGVRVLTVSAARGLRRTVHQVSIRTAQATEELARLREATALRKQRKQLEQATATFSELVGSADPVIRAKSTAQLARMLAAEDINGAITLLYTAMDMARIAGRISDEVGDGLVLSVFLVDHAHDLGAADDVLARIEPLLDRFDEGRAMAAHFRGLNDLVRGDLGAALARFTDSEVMAERLDLEGHLADVQQRRLEVLDALGRKDEALRYAKTLLPFNSADPCAKAQYLNNLAWHKMLAGVAEQEDARRNLDDALSLFSSVCFKPHQRFNTLTNLVLLELLRGHINDAERFLADARDAVRPRALHLDVEWRLLASHLALARGDRSAAASFAATARLARIVGRRDHEIAALLGQAEALEIAGDLDGALDAYEEADVLLSQWGTFAVALGEGRQSFFTRNERGVRRYLDLLFLHGETERAACVVRRSLVRAVATGAWMERVGRSRERIALWENAFQQYDAVIQSLAQQAEPLTDEASRAAIVLLLVEQARVAASRLDHRATEIAGAGWVPSCAGDATDLPAPAADEVMLIYHPVGEDTWLGIALTRDGARVDIHGGHLTQP